MKKDRLTPFQWEVLKITTKIPLGQTRSYKWVANKLQKPEAVRAVGQALKRNPYPLIIPCHRVIKEDGSLGGYSGRGGTKTKQNLLLLEKKIARYLKESKSH